MMAAREPAGGSAGPKHAPLVLIALILAAAVANLNLVVVNVALPRIGRAKTAFVHGDHWACTAGLIADLAGAVIILPFFPKKERAGELLARYHEQDRPAAIVPATDR